MPALNAICSLHETQHDEQLDSKHPTARVHSLVSGLRGRLQAWCRSAGLHKCIGSQVPLGIVQGLYMISAL